MWEIRWVGSSDDCHGRTATLRRVATLVIGRLETAVSELAFKRLAGSKVLEIQGH